MDFKSTFVLYFMIPNHLKFILINSQIGQEMVNVV